ncbi:unnamed protein product [Cuscuta epithymum]|uniref:Uncharacterized protein n=1 Tax=Cuscuta epithymum TaxID=186058 RepID=A0AAV0CRT1_9ASTE|nr:unnamed protein product [Cuscuta epithymum]
MLLGQANEWISHVSIMTNKKDDTSSLRGPNTDRTARWGCKLDYNYNLTDREWGSVPDTCRGPMHF